LHAGFSTIFVLRAAKSSNSCVEIKEVLRLLSYISNAHLVDMTASLRSKLHSFCEMPTKKPRRGPNCGANTPMPEPSLIS
jgi:hypothetical protein